jgi:hypothetical protein
MNERMNEWKNGKMEERNEPVHRDVYILFVNGGKRKKKKAWTN